MTLNTGQVTRRFTYPLRTALLYDIITISMLSVILKISRFLPAFLKSKKGKKSEFLQFRGGLIPDSFIVFSRWILNDYNSIITIIISIHFTFKPSSLRLLPTFSGQKNRFFFYLAKCKSVILSSIYKRKILKISKSGRVI